MDNNEGHWGIFILQDDARYNAVKVVNFLTCIGFATHSCSAGTPFGLISLPADVGYVGLLLFSLFSFKFRVKGTA